MNKNKYYRVKKKVDRSGNTVYQVEACEGFWGIVFGMWMQYTKENPSLDDAISQVESLAGWKLESEKVVYKKRIV